MNQVNKRILIIEDERSLRKVLKDKIIQEGLEALEAGDGEEGLKIALAEKPALILLDIIMPKMDGIDMLRRLRLDDWGKTVPVLVLTNLDSESKVEAAMAAHTFDYLIKSDLSIEEVVKKIKDKLGF
jgi:DNA-binding response OmpR family regulator